MQIDYVFLLNEFLWNYYKQLDIYEERNLRIETFLKNKKNKYADNNIKCYDAKEESKIELWN